MDHVSTWIFDLDNTLYPLSARLFDQVEARMNDWVMRALNLDPVEANRLRADYYQRYGTTLSGLMQEHGIDPADFLAHVHDIPLDALTPDPGLAAAIRALPGRKLIYTNGTGRYAQRITEARGLGGVFEAMYGIDDADYLPKPRAEAFQRILLLAGVDPAHAAMFEDDPRNLLVPHQLGMACIQVHTPRLAAAHVHHHTDDLTGFLTGLARSPA